MKYTKKDLGSYNLHLINTDKFKTITIRVLFHTPIKKEEVTKRTILTDLLLYSSNKYDSRRKLTIEAEDLYSADISASNQRLGNYIMTTFNLKVLMDKYTEENNLEKAIEFLSEIIFNPDIENNRFKKDKIDYIKHNTKISIDSLKEDTTTYSLIKLYEAYDKESPLSYRIQGYLDDLDNIDGTSLYETYTKMINNDYVDIFVVGDFENKEMLTLIKKYFKFKKIKKKKESYVLKNKKSRKRRLFVKEEIDNSQSQLVMACPINRLSTYERDYVLPLMNIIFGGGVDSKLFREVREKNSLCYTIYSMTSKFDNIMTIVSGIDKSNYNKAVLLITKKLDDMKKGKFTDKDMDTAKAIYKANLENIPESEMKMVNEVFNRDILDTDDYKKRLDNIKNVKKQDIVKVSKKVNIDTVFLLEGVNDEED